MPPVHHYFVGETERKMKKKNKANKQFLIKKTRKKTKRKKEGVKLLACVATHTTGKQRPRPGINSITLLPPYRRQSLLRMYCMNACTTAMAGTTPKDKLA